MTTPKTLVVSLVGAGCIAAAGLGGYLAARSGSTPAAAAAAPPVTGGTAAPDSPRNTTESPVSAPATRGARPARPVPTAAATPTRTSPLAVPAAPNRTASQAPIEEVDRTAGSEPADPAADQPVADAETPAGGSPPAGITAASIPDYDELTVRADSVIGIRLDAAVSSETARVEDRVTARVTRDVSVDGRVAVPSGSMLEGIVTNVQRGGRFKERARLGVRFTSVVLADNQRVPIQTETIYRVGDAPTGEATAKIGGAAVVGAILGSVIGGKKGAAIGTTAGAAGGTAAVMAGDVNNAVIAAGAPLTVRLTAPATVPVEHQP